MIYFKVDHKCFFEKRLKIREIGIYNSLSKALTAIELLKTKNGFNETADGFKIKKIFRLFKPTFLNKTFWADGFDTYYFDRISNILCCDEEKMLMKHFDFLINDYGFKFDKLNLGNMVNENGKLIFYGPYNCYYFYNNKICINFINLVQRQDWEIYITQYISADQNFIKKGRDLPGYCYKMPLMASVIKKELEEKKTILGFNID